MEIDLSFSTSSGSSTCFSTPSIVIISSVDSMVIRITPPTDTAARFRTAAAAIPGPACTYHRTGGRSLPGRDRLVHPTFPPRFRQ